MGLFSGLEELGLKKKVVIYAEKEKKETVTEQPPEKTQEVKPQETDYLFLKSYQCPVCDSKFKTLTVRAGKLRPVGQGAYLRPLFKEMDPIKYDAIVCMDCGYAALSRYFDMVMPLQARRIRAEVGNSFLGLTCGEDMYSYDDAIMRYKMVLYCDVVGDVKNSRKAYTCLKLAWVIRGKLEAEGPELSKEECENLRADELECIQNAYDGYMKAFSTENFPMSGMDEPTLRYLTAELAFGLHKYKDSLQLLAKIIGNRNTPPKIRDRAVDLKEEIRAKVSTAQ
jgi:hypothetical protein